MRCQIVLFFFDQRIDPMRNISRARLYSGENIESHSHDRHHQDQYDPHELETRIASGIENVDQDDDGQKTDGIVDDPGALIDKGKSSKQDHCLHQQQENQYPCSAKNQFPKFL